MRAVPGLVEAGDAEAEQCGRPIQRLRDAGLLAEPQRAQRLGEFHDLPAEAIADLRQAQLQDGEFPSRSSGCPDNGRGTAGAVRPIVRGLHSRSARPGEC